ncbi:class II lanthipeptide, LchA2/BrtA2 family [Lactiplantibacillus plantarum]|uniref:Plantaricin W beta n=1 Tax=Lactiplantibacillus plantarum TaxID=1590 RepID=Q9AF68_LACPN|nr:class II lanthipeptide, LchA2/BrtA2 family [Lactiplantibacillus plantarum]AAG02566.1 plantaricin W beta precursor [Lactiplantibacillus plantarum]AGA35574.1 plantaricin W beta precursor [Lactiplantibacillus plantarum]AGA35576.1 plantaricin W beta precursor [Lactiplantibacillus plantarum]AGA35578.1 plantaricin W beta precursor [Lactiplantibacillus plantarum]AGA35580.1 plantaricin W beta precursor [Lactiplantibacillus plantarum]
MTKTSRRKNAIANYLEPVDEKSINESFGAGDPEARSGIPCTIGAAVAASIAVCPTTKCSKRCGKRKK